MLCHGLRRFTKLTAAVAILAMALVIKQRGFDYVPFLQRDDRVLRWSAEDTVSADQLPDVRIYNEPPGYIINPVHMCGNNSGSLDYLFLILSATNHFEHRRVIRETWGNELRQFSGIRLGFLLGQPQNSQIQSAIVDESLENSDLIQGDFEDTYYTTVRKIVMMLHWTLRYCPDIKFLIRMDDDGVLNVPNFFKSIVLKPQNALYGLLVHGYEVIRDPNHKNYYSKEEFPMDVAPDFLAGAMVFLGRGTLKSLYKGTGLAKAAKSDDSFLTGRVAEMVGVPLVHQEGIEYFRMNSTCDLKRAIFYQDMTPTEMRKVWNELQRTTYTCHYLAFSVHICFCTTLEEKDANGDTLLL